MPIILTVEDSRAVRNVIARHILELGFDLEQAENGEQGLERLSAGPIDLVLLDVTMPVLDGPAMLERMRKAGNRTPVIMLTSEAKRSIVESTLQLGISDYILKPFTAEELKAKIVAVLGEAAVTAPAPVAAPAPAPAAKAGGTTDFLIVDDIENVAIKLRSLVPEARSVEHLRTPTEALRACGEKSYKVILVDADLPADAGAPDVHGAALVARLKAAQPRATVVAMCLRTINDSTDEMRKQGYAEVLFKPFRKDDVEALIASHVVEQEEPFTRQDDVLVLGAFVGKADRLEAYFARIASLAPAALEQLAAACHEHVILDLRKAPADAPKLPECVESVAAQARKIGLGTKLVVSEAVKRAMATRPGTRGLWTFAEIGAARAAEVDPNSGPPSDKDSWIARMQDL